MSRPQAAPAPGARPAGIIVVALVVVLEAMAFLGIFCWYAYGLLTQVPVSLGGSLFMLFLLLLAAVWLLAVGHFLFRGYRWTRSAALVFQLFMIIFAVSMFSSALPLLGAAMLIPAGTAIVLLFTVPVSRFLVRLTDKTAAL